MHFLKFGLLFRILSTCQRLCSLVGKIDTKMKNIYLISFLDQLRFIFWISIRNEHIYCNMLLCAIIGHGTVTHWLANQTHEWSQMVGPLKIFQLEYNLPQRYNLLKMVTVRKMIFVNNQKNKIEDLERFEMQQAEMKELKSLKSWSPQRHWS